MRRQAHQTLAKVTDDIGRRRTFNTAIAAVMELLNAAGQVPAARPPQDRSVMQEALEIAVLALSPIIPHVTHALWRALGHATALIDEPWPAVDAGGARAGDRRDRRAGQRQAARAHLRSPSMPTRRRCARPRWPIRNVQKFVGAAPVRKVIVVPGKLVNVRRLMHRTRRARASAGGAWRGWRCAGGAGCWRGCGFRLAGSAIRCRRCWRGPICR